MPLKEILDSGLFLSLSLLHSFHKELPTLCTTMMFCLIAGPKDNGAKQPWTETSESEPKQTFSPYKLIISGVVSH
jgi:hypothetical protein